MTEAKGYITSPVMSTIRLQTLMRAVESVGSAQVGMLGGLGGVVPRCEVPTAIERLIAMDATQGPRTMLRGFLLFFASIYLVAAITQASADERNFDEIVWCSDGFDGQKATFKLTDEGYQLTIGDSTELLHSDGGTTSWGGGIMTSAKDRKDVIVLPGELVYGHDMELKRRVVILRDRVFTPCDDQ
jgi:hypothetical protein